MARVDAVRARFREEAMQRGTNPRDVDLLLADAVGHSVAWVIAHGEAEVDAAQIGSRMERRFAGEPLQYIRGKTEFYGREFYVDERVLIPRPETEVLVEAAIARIPHGARVVDVGTGSGCIAVTLARERPDLRVIGVDASVAALAVARRNGLVHAAASDVLSAVRGFDFVVSNPPYIPRTEYESLETQVRDHEPRAALTPGPRGTEVIERILEQARGVPVIFEIGFGQDIRDIATARGYAIEEVIHDLAGIPRTVILKRRADVSSARA
jgi:release factor glutamine methyltransferase